VDVKRGQVFDMDPIQARPKIDRGWVEQVSGAPLGDDDEEDERGAGRAPRHPDAQESERTTTREPAPTTRDPKPPKAGAQGGGGKE